MNTQNPKSSAIFIPKQDKASSLKAIADVEFPGVDIAKAAEFIAFINDEPYITGAGLQWKMMDKYGAGKYAIEALIPSAEEYALLRRMMALKDDEPMVVIRGEVWIEGFDRPFTDYGTTTPKNLKGFVKFSDYPLEMATRRATNRAMRLATATGMCSVDEIKTPNDERPEPPKATQGAESKQPAGKPEPKKQQTQPSPQKSNGKPKDDDPMTPEQEDAINSLLASVYEDGSMIFSDDEKGSTGAKMAGSSFGDAKNRITGLSKRIKDRREEKKGTGNAS